MATNPISFQEFCIENKYPPSLSYRVLVKMVAEYVQANGQPKGKNKLISFENYGFLVKDYGTKRTFYIITDKVKFKPFIATLVGYENLLDKNLITDVFYCAKYGYEKLSFKEEYKNKLSYALKRVGLL